MPEFSEDTFALGSSIVVQQAAVSLPMLRDCLKDDSTVWIGDRFVQAAIELVLRASVVAGQLTVGPWKSPIGLCALLSPLSSVTKRYCDHIEYRR